jgi:hypothetical protein
MATETGNPATPATAATGANASASPGGLPRFPELAGQSVILTGGTRGIGLGIARLLAASGARLMITGRKAHRLERVAEELSAAGADFRTRVSDVADRDASRRLVDDTLAAFGDAGPRSGPDRDLRLLDGADRRARLRPVLRGEGGGSLADADGGSRVGPLRDHRQLRLSRVRGASHGRRSGR